MSVSRRNKSSIKSLGVDRRQSGRAERHAAWRRLFFEALEDRRLLAAAPTATLNLPATAFIGDTVNFSVTFDNTSPTNTDVGYGPFVDLILPRNGADGAAGTAAPDGLTFTSATYLGTSVTATVFTFPDDDLAGPGTTGTIQHPYAVDSSGNPLTVTGTAGDQLVVLQLPFASFVPDQPPADIQVRAALSNLADLNTPLTVRARGGFLYGADELNNPATDPTILTPGSESSVSSTWGASDDTTPVVMKMTKTYNGPEQETATGPNYPRQWTLTTNIAPGQTVTNLDIIDGLPNNVVVTGISVLTSHTPAPTVHAVPFGPGIYNFGANQLVLATIPIVTGDIAADDVVVQVTYYVPEFDANGYRVIPIDGEDDIGPPANPNSTSPNDSRSLGDWTPIDTRDPGGADNAMAEPDLINPDNTVDDKSIAIQKSVANVDDVAPSGNTPGDTLEYTLDFQISDYYTFGDLVVTDTLQDGQDFLDTYAPTITITDRNGNVTGSFALGTNYTHTNNDATDGTEVLVFNVSNALQDNGAADGILEGGCTHSEPDSAPGTAATGVIRFRTVIQEDYAQTPPSGDHSVDQGDLIDNKVKIAGSVRQNWEDDPAHAFNVLLAEETDDSASRITIVTGALAKSIYAVNGSTSFSPTSLAPGDRVTYSLTYTLSISDFEQLRLTDFLPLPVFRVGDPDGNGAAGPAWSFDLLNSFDATPPAPGVVEFGPDDTFYALSGIEPARTIDDAANSLEFAYPNFDNPASNVSNIQLLFTVTARNAPFADGMFLTNQAQAEEQNSFNTAITKDAIQQIQLGVPELNLTKGVVATDKASAVFTDPVGPVAFTAPTTVPTANPRWTGTIDSDGLEASPIDSDLTGIDAGDLVTFAIVVENTGTGRLGAFDVRVQDSLPAGFAVPGSGLNLSVTDGTGAAIGYTELGDGGGDDLFGAGIELTDPGPTGAVDPPTDNTNAGALDQYNATSGRNILVITYDLVAQTAVQPRQTITNTATLTNYAGTEGGPDYTTDDLTDPAEVTVAEPAVNKTILATNQTHTTGANVAIGELVQYQAVITVPEGTSHGVQLVDVLDQGLAHMGADNVSYPISITASTGVATSIGGGFSYIATHPVITDIGLGLIDQGRILTLDFGTITNSNTSNATAETITVTYWVAVLNGGNNDRGEDRHNNAQFQWTLNTVTQTVTNPTPPAVNIVEPLMQVTKTAAPHIVDQGDPVTFTLDVSHIAVTDNADAFDVTLSDIIPAGLTYVPGSLIHTGAGIAPTTLSESGGTISAEWSTFPTTDTSQLQFQATVDAGAQLGSVITNTAGIAWTSLPGPVITAQSTHNDFSVERTGDTANVGGADNDYRASDSDEVSIQNPAMTKAIVSPAAPFQATIGQQLTYRITLTIPEGTVGNAQLVDTLDAGLAIVNLPDLASNLSIVPDSHITTSKGTFADVINAGVVPSDGSTLTLDFGTLTNSDSNNATAETIVITYHVVVLNEGVNTAGQAANNRAVFTSTAAPAAASALNVTIVEPKLQLTKSNSAPLVAQAGDRVVFTFTVEHTGLSTANAYDVVLTDLFGAVAPRNYFTYHTSDPLTVVSGPVPTFSESPGTGDLTVVWGTFPLGSVTVLSVPVTLDNDAPIATTLNNVADLTWTSVLGDFTAPQSTNPASVERTGDPTKPAGPLNYWDDDNGITQTPGPSFTKLIESTSHHGTGTTFHNAAIEDVAVGEEITFLMIGVIPDGVTHTLPLTDTLPAGMELVSAVVQTIGDDIYEDPGYTNPLLPSEVVVNTTTTTVQFVFPEYLYNDPDPAVPGAADNTFLFEVTAVVTNVVSNQDGVRLTNTAVAGYYDVNGNPQTLTATADVEVVEPDLSITKVASPTTGVAGDTVTFTVTVNHTASSTANAYHVEIADILPAEMTYVDNLQLVHGLLPTVVQVGQSLTFSWNEIPYPPASPGATDAPYTFTFDVTLNANLPSGQTVTNDATVTWWSLPGTTDNTRDGSGGVGGLLNNYAATDGDDVTSGVTARNPDKRLVTTSESTTTNPDVVIGEVVRYRLQVAVDQGTVPDFRLTDLLPAGMQFLNDGNARVALVASTPADITSSTLAGAGLQVAGDETTVAGITPSFVLPGSAILGAPFNDGIDPTFSLGNIVNSEVDASQEFVIVEFNARVLDVAGNESGDTLSNHFTASRGTTVLTTSNSVGVNVVEPRLTVQKTAVPVDGTHAHYTVRVANSAPSTAAAVQAVITDLLAGPGITLDDGSVTIDAATTVPGGNIAITTGNGSGDTTIRLDVTVFPLNTVLVFRYDATLNTSGPQSASANNTANVAWTSATSNGRNGTASDGEVLGAIGDRVWYDLDGQGDQDGSEPGWPGVPVELVWAGPDGNLNTAADNVTLTTTTDASGNYQFGLLPAGVYRVTATPPAGTTPTYDADGGFNNTSTLTLAGGAVNSLQDFGYTGTGSIGDTVWVDLDGNGTQNGSEPGIPNVTVNLVWFGPDGVLGGGDDVNFTAVTDANGHYSFPRLPAGNFQVDLATATLPEGLSANTPTTLAVPLGSGEAHADADFGARGLGSLGDRVFHDLNNNGLFDDGEGFSSVDVTVTGDLDGDGTNESVVVTTGTDGLWTLNGLRTTAIGLNYTVTVDTGDLPYGLPWNIVDPNGGNDSTSSVPLTTAAPANDAQDFGYRFPPQAANDSLSNLPPGAAMVHVIANDPDPDNDLLTGSIDLDPTTPGQQTTLTVPSQGTWTVSTTYPGYVLFTPAAGFTQDPAPIQYTVTDAIGLTSAPATITLDYRPVTTNDTSTGNEVTGGVAPPVTVNVLANDTNGDLVDRTTVQIVNPPAGSTLSSDGKTLTVPGQGTWTVLGTGEIRFEPQSGFTGDPTPIRYTVKDHEGNTSNSATVTIDYVQAGSACTTFPFTLVIDDLSTPGLDIVIVDNKGIGAAGAGGLTSTVADGSMTVTGEIYFSGSTPKYSLARVTARSKPLVGTTAEPENITLSTAFRSATGGAIVVEATDSCYQMVNGQVYSLTTPLGGTTNGSVTFTETVDLENDPFVSGTPNLSNTIGPSGAGAVSGTKVTNFTSPAYVSMDKKLTVTHPTGAKLTTMSAGGILSGVSEDALSPALSPGAREEDALTPSLLKYRHAAEAGELAANPLRSLTGLGSRPGTGLDRLEAYPTSREQAATDYARAGDLLFARWGGASLGRPSTPGVPAAAGESRTAASFPLTGKNGSPDRLQKVAHRHGELVRNARAGMDLQGVDVVLSVEDACWAEAGWL